ncbi:MAG: CPBP family intramembrane glutamic endopeptidase [Terriglobales bacterium]|jgi:membrane protease YdiL (CAAX protease family)
MKIPSANEDHEAVSREPLRTPDTPPNGKRSLAIIFVGNQGLRTGWSALLFISLVLAFGLSARALVRAITHTERSQTIMPVPSLLRESAQLGALFLATLIMARIERRSVFSYGFRGNRKLIRLVSGTVVGFLLISGLVGLLWITHALAFDGKMVHGLLAWKYALLWFAMFLVVAFFEEGLLRGYLQFTLTRRLTFWGAAAVLSVLFGLLHVGNEGESPIGILAAIAAGLVFCLSLKLTGSLWWIVGVHTGLGFAESYFYGTANSGVVAQGHLYATHPVGKAFWSGGTTGPEGSIYALLALLLMAAGMWLTWGRRRALPLSNGR